MDNQSAQEDRPRCKPDVLSGCRLSLTSFAESGHLHVGCIIALLFPILESGNGNRAAYGLARFSAIQTNGDGLMPTYEADVRPNQPWNVDGTAEVTPRPLFPDLSTFRLPLEHRPGGPVTVLRTQYPAGLVIIPTGSPPSGPSAVLPMQVSTGDAIVVSNGEHQDWPWGIVVRFID